MSEAEKVAELTEASLRQPQTIVIGHDGLKAEVLLVPNDNGGYHQHSVKKLLDEYREFPERRVGTATLTDLESFIAHTKRFADEDSIVFMDRSGPSPKLISVLDYHRKTAAGQPRFGKHRGVYTFPLSDEWVAWTGQNAKPMTQEDFGRWLEDHLTEIATPDSAGKSSKQFVELLSCGFASPSALLALSKGLEVHVGQKIKEHRRLATGEASLQFDESHTDSAGAPLKVPGAFLLGLPVFRNGELYQIPARLRYRVSGTITWSYELHRASAIMDDALNAACVEVGKECGIDVFEGTPE